MAKKLFIHPRERFGNPRDIQLLMFTAWDSDTGNYTMKEEVWHVFMAALELELKRRNVKRSRKLVPIRMAAKAVGKPRQDLQKEALAKPWGRHQQCLWPSVGTQPLSKRDVQAARDMFRR